MFGDPKILNAEDARKAAKWRLPALAFDYIDGSAGREEGERLNRQALGEVRLRVRSLRDVDSVDTRKSVFGQQYDLPVGIAPMGGCNLAAPGADEMLARLAADQNVPIGASTVATSALEDIWAWSQGKAWFQLYFSGDGEGTLRLAQRAKQAGYKTIVLTVDVPVLGRRPREIRQGFKMPFRLTPQTFVDFACHPLWSIPMLFSKPPGLGNFTPSDAKNGHIFDRTETRAKADTAWFHKLRALWEGNIVVKGVLDPDDARALKAMGADAIQVSSHGGRQLDSTPLPVPVLPMIRRAVGQDFPLFYDSGIRSGEDVMRALALGADFCFLGRPLLYAIGGGGKRGLEQLWHSIRTEFDIAMAMTGQTNLDAPTQALWSREEKS